MRLKALQIWSIISLFGLLISAADAAGLPNGATSLNETFGDWRVGCKAVKKEAVVSTGCVVEQVQMRKGKRQRVLSISVVPQPDGGIKGSILLPFGLDLQAGVLIRIDEGKSTPPVPFTTCRPAGCVIRIDWQEPTIKGMKAGTALHIVTKNVAGQDLPFAISLKGFSAAIERAAALMAEE